MFKAHHTALVACAAVAWSAAPAVAQEPETEEDKAFYTLGIALSQNLSRFSLTGDELEMVIAGLRDGALGNEPQVDPQAYTERLGNLARERAVAALDAEKSESAKFVGQLAAEKGAETSDSGLVYIEMEGGDGASPGPTDTVTVHYHGQLRDGTVFDSSVDRGQPATFPLNRVIACWTEGVQKMKVGGKSKLVCPSDIAYGDRGSPPRIAPGAALLFEVELISIEEAS